MKKFQKIKIRLLCMMLFAGISISPIQAKAEETPDNRPYWERDDDAADYFKIKGDIVYGIDKDKASIYEIFTKEREIIVPETIDGYPVVELDGVYLNEQVETLRIPKTVKKISELNASPIDEIFEEQHRCEYNFQSIVVDKENKYFTSVKGVLYNKKKTALVRCPNARTEFKIPKTVKKIKEDAFRDTELKEIKLPDTVKEIERAAFYSCQKLKKVTFSKSMKVIPKSAFFLCQNLKQITIPANIKEIQECAFLASPIKKVVFEKNSKLKLLGGFSGCPLQEIKIPEGVEEIGYEAFIDCSELKSMEIPKSVKFIDADAFSRCKKLKKLIIKSRMIDAKQLKYVLPGLNKKKVTITAPKDSKAYKYAKKQGFKVKAL